MSEPAPPRDRSAPAPPVMTSLPGSAVDAVVAGAAEQRVVAAEPEDHVVVAAAGEVLALARADDAAAASAAALRTPARSDRTARPLAVRVRGGHGEPQRVADVGRRSGSTRPSSRPGSCGSSRRSRRSAATRTSSRSAGRRSYVPTSAVSCRPVVNVPAIDGARHDARAEVLLVDDRERVVRDRDVGARDVRAGDPDADREPDVLHGRRVGAASSRPGSATQVAKSPTGLQRRHEYVNVIGVEPSHVPAVSDNGVSTTLPPRICGVTRSFTGRAITGALDSEFCAAEPCAFVAVTWTRRRLPASAATGV